jgi:hypothetical protein
MEVEGEHCPKATKSRSKVNAEQNIMAKSNEWTLIIL